MVGPFWGLRCGGHAERGYTRSRLIGSVVRRTPVASRTALASAGRDRVERRLAHRLGAERAERVGGAGEVHLGPRHVRQHRARGTRAASGWSPGPPRRCPRARYSAAPRACATPPSTCPRHCTGLMTVPASAACTLCRMRISPVAGAHRDPEALHVERHRSGPGRRCAPRPPAASRRSPPAAAIASASARAARSVAIPATTMPVEPYAPVSCSTSSVSADTSSISSTVAARARSPRAGGARWRSRCRTPPCPTASAVAAARRAARSGRAPRWPPGGTRVEHASPRSRGRPASPSRPAPAARARCPAPPAPGRGTRPDAVAGDLDVVRLGR